MTSPSPKRQRIAKAFGWIGLLVLVAWIGFYVQKVMTHSIRLHYVYKNIPSSEQLTKVIGELRKEDGTLHARIVFLHKYPRQGSSLPSAQNQSLSLPKGTYHITVLLRYQHGLTRVLRQTIPITDQGTVYLHLKRAKPVPSHPT